MAKDTKTTKLTNWPQVRKTHKNPKLNLNQQALVLVRTVACVCLWMCTIVVHNIALNSSDNLPSCPPCLCNVAFLCRSAWPCCTWIRWPKCCRCLNWPILWHPTLHRSSCLEVWTLVTSLMMPSLPEWILVVVFISTFETSWTLLPVYVCAVHTICCWRVLRINFMSVLPNDGWNFAW